MEHRFQFVLAHKYVDPNDLVVQAWLVPTCTCGWFGGFVWVEEAHTQEWEMNEMTEGLRAKHAEWVDGYLDGNA